MNRRAFLAGLVGTAGGLVLPEPARILVPEPPRVRAYSFLPGNRGLQRVEVSAAERLLVITLLTMNSVYGKFGQPSSSLPLDIPSLESL